MSTHVTHKIPNNKHKWLCWNLCMYIDITIHGINDNIKAPTRQWPYFLWTNRYSNLSKVVFVLGEGAAYTWFIFWLHSYEPSLLVCTHHFVLLKDTKRKNICAKLYIEPCKLSDVDEVNDVHHELWRLTNQIKVNQPAS